MQEILGATYRLLVKTRVHHWNVVGPLFHPIHLMTEAQYEDLFAATDTLAERIRALGHPTAAPRIGTEAATTTKMSVEQLVGDLVEHNEAIVRLMRDAAEAAEEARDLVTHDLLVARMTVHEKAIWMLRAVAASCSGSSSFPFRSSSCSPSSIAEAAGEPAAVFGSPTGA